ncbi:MAG: hypothetical protein KC591_03510 [Gemmatimonadetes bacterium]|nr:hypothetical protein [Gemmatimonadota bacterium]
MRVSLSLGALLLLAGLPVQAEPVPQTAPGPVEEPVEAEHSPVDNTVPEIRATLEVRGFQLRELRPDPRYHRGGVYVDEGEGQPGALTSFEESKLASARQAIEASRVAGTLYSTILPEDAVAPTEDELAERKLDLLEDRAAINPSDDPLAGIAGDLPSVQEMGPEGMTAAELAKLNLGTTGNDEGLESDEATRGVPAVPTTDSVDDSQQPEAVADRAAKAANGQGGNQ